MKHSNHIHVSASETNLLIEEFNKLSTIVNLGIRTGNNFADAEITSDVFKNFKLDFQRDCPHLTDLIHIFKSHIYHFLSEPFYHHSFDC